MTVSSDQEPILASWKISDVLQRYPQSLDLLVDLSPAFSKLRNPVMRRVQSRLVTVAQAAEIAGIAPADLTRRLNQAAGITSTETESPASQADEVSSSSLPAPWVETAPVVAELDVRPIMAQGEEPFQAIMKTARGVQPGSAFRLLVGFEPLPLYDALAKLGFTEFATQQDDLWNVLFYRLPVHDEPISPPKAVDPEPINLDWNAPAIAEVSIDVSELVPPEPMIKILQALEALPPNGRLLVHHVRRPIHLYDRLNEMGYAHDTRELSPGHVEVLIQKRVG